MKTGILYHAKCTDGFTAAWLTAAAVGSNYELVPCYYGDDIAIVNKIAEGEYTEVYMVDFSIAPEALATLAAIPIYIYDHHKSAAEKYARYFGKPLRDLSFAHSVAQHFILFEQEECGASLVAKYLVPEMYDSPIVRYVKDRDLWTKELPSTEEVSAYIGSFEHSLEEWDRIAKEVATTPHHVIQCGAAILRYKRKLIETAVTHAEPCNIRGKKGLYTTCPRELASDVGNRLAELSGTYGITSAGTGSFSIRSIGDYDVAAIASIFGGGGHKNAAGFAADAIEVFL